MSKVFKSYLRTYLKQWIESLGLVLFITVLSLVVIGMIASPMQLSTKSNKILNQSNLWNYSLVSAANKFDDEFTYDYFVDNSDQYYLNPILENTDQKGILTDEGYQALLKKDKDPTIIENKLAWGKDLKEVLNLYFNNKNSSTNIFNGTKNLTASEMLNSEYQRIIANYYNDASFYVNKNILDLQKDKFAFAVDLEFYYEGYQKQGDLTPSAYYYLTSKTEHINSQSKSWINNLVMVEGTNKLDANSLVITDKFARDNAINIDQKLDFYALGTLLPELKTATISGFGSKADTLSQSSYFSFTGDPKKYGAIFVNDSILEDLYNKVWLGNKPQNFVFGLNQKVKFLNNSSYVDFRNIFSKKTDSDFSIYKKNQNVLTPFSSIKSISTLNSMNITVTVYIILGAGLSLLAFIFISFVMKKEMNKTRRQIGIFKALGYRTSELSWIFTVKTLITILLGILLGYLCSIPLQIYMYGQFQGMVTFSYNQVYAGISFMLVLFLVIPLLFTIASYISTFIYIKEPILSLVNNVGKSQKLIRQGLISRSLAKRGKGFTWRLQLAFTSRNKGKFALVIILFFFSSLMLILMLGATGVANSIIGGIFNTMNPKVDHVYTFNNFPKVNGTDDKGKLTVSDEQYNTYQFEYKTYQTIDDITKENSSADKFHEGVLAASSIKEYLALLNTYKVKDQNTGLKQYIYLSDLKTIFSALQEAGPNGIQTGDDSFNGPVLMELAANAMMMSDQAQTVVSFNDLWYKPSTETMVYQIEGEITGNLENSGANLVGVFQNDSIGGNYATGYNWTGVSQSTINQIFADQPNNTNTVNGLISYKLALNGNFKVGDQITIKSETQNKVPININIVGVIRNDTVTSNIYTGYNNLFTNIFVPGTLDPSQPEHNFYTGFYSQEKLYNGFIDLKDMATSISQLQFQGNNLSIIANDSKTIWEAITDQNSYVVTGTLMGMMTSQRKSDFSVFPIDVMKATINDVLEKQNNSMILFEVLVALVVLILLVVIVMVVIDEVAPIILTLKAIGYKNAKINFVVIGNYVFGIIIAFIFAWLGSVLIWQMVGIIVYKFFATPLNIPIDFTGPLIALAIVSVILFASWILAMHSIKNRPVTQITE
ncbi:ABC transporter permease [Spiroplasma chrysopicola]|uniref:ABC transporter permease n=1 Tax=Spiroplasma chrysopicola DF-1 TaxID=1276227 RepID=R4UH01_9MOLU|nr:ABC transporter permease [Spiroplasma chrysopicola]AGM24606.1 ABC transporter permease [Spiroplasma chrysopicola DF-1]